VPKLELKKSEDSTYVKIPALQFPVDEQGRTVLVQDVKFYSKEAMYQPFKAWRDGKSTYTGAFDKKGFHAPTLDTRMPVFRQDEEELGNMEELFTTEIFPGNIFGIRWKDNPTGTPGKFPQYFLKTGENSRVPVAAAEVPAELVSEEFELAEKGKPYTSPNAGAWGTPGPASEPIEVSLVDGSTVTYCWYRFVDQPSLQQFDWSNEEKEQLQSLVEKMHANWGIDKEYMEPQTEGELVSFDPALMVMPPKGYEVGYVPIVTGQQ
jgi:hypothetical protein